MAGGLQHITWKERLRELPLSSLGTRTLRDEVGDRAVTCSHQRGSYTASADKRFSLTADHIAWAHGHNLQLGRFRVDITRCFFVTRNSAAGSGDTQDSALWEQSSKKL